MFNPIQWINDRIHSFTGLPYQWQAIRNDLHLIMQQTSDPEARATAVTINSAISDMLGEYTDVTRKLETQQGGSLGQGVLIVGIIGGVAVVTWVIYKIIKLFKETTCAEVAKNALRSGYDPIDVRNTFIECRKSKDAEARKEAESNTGNPLTAVGDIVKWVVIGGVAFMVLPLLTARGKK